MRLLVVSWWMPYPPDNGTRQRAFNLLKHLSRRHSLTLLAFGVPRGPEDIAPLQELCDRVRILPPRTLETGRLGIEGLFSAVPRYYVQTKSKEMTTLVEAAASDHDAVLALTCGAGLHLSRTARTMPSVLDEIEVGVPREQYVLERNLVRRVRHGLTWWKYRRFIRFLTTSFDRSTVVSNLEREHLRAMGCDVGRVAVVPNGVNVPDIEPASTRARRLIYPGSVMYSANLDAVRFFVTEIFPLVRRAAPDLVFTVTGATDGVDIGDLAGVEGVTFTGRLPDVDALIAESAACVVPLRIGGGTRLKVLHAMALSTPVVATPKGVEGLDLEPNRHVLVAENPDTLAAQIVRVVNDASLACRLVSEGRAVVRERYAWGPIASTLEGVIQSAVEDHRSGQRRQAYSGAERRG